MITLGKSVTARPDQRIVMTVYDHLARGDHLDDYHMGDVIRDQSFIFQVVGIDLM